MQRISDNGDLEPLPFDNDPELVKWAQYGVELHKAQNRARDAEIRAAKQRREARQEPLSP